VLTPKTLRPVAEAGKIEARFLLMNGPCIFAEPRLRLTPPDRSLNACAAPQIARRADRGQQNFFHSMT
jgi:hypothetical protein